ncbi:hypothetical protein [Rhizobacter sp. Root1221]|uniref:hypothetical protein n=1 Tax=Rhizobacter sp. Root1221 TaxID=1736433 RepID=UPI0006F9B84F|nr:hypothetical protein [Rhizobacter sp. Root1221]KQV91529.1 hypothetical protein ASC87_05375 [Rhizobacter sp. Root1221]
MKFARDLSKISARTRLAAALFGAVLLASCGGGEQEEKFQASRIVTFGDENSLIRPDGTQYTVNNTSVATAAPCATSPIWVQRVAGEYGLTFGECTNTAARPSAVMRAVKESKVADVAAAVAATPLQSGDLVTLMVGAYDVIEITAGTANPDSSQLAAMNAAAFERGRAFGSVVLAVTATGAKVLFTTVPDLGLAPLGLRNVQNATALSQLSRSFNNGLIDRVSEDSTGGGRNGAVLEVDQQVERYRRNIDAAYSGFTNYTDAACNTAGVPFEVDDLPTCTTIANASYLWAGNIQFGLLTHSQLGSDAVGRLRANPL